MPMVKVGHVIVDDEVLIRYIFNLCTHKISKQIRHYLIVDRAYDYVNDFRQHGISCIITDGEGNYKKVFKKMDIINFHWFRYHKNLHTIVNDLQIPFVAALYGPERLPASIPLTICPFGYIKKMQSSPSESIVIRDGLNLRRLTKYRNPCINVSKGKAFRNDKLKKSSKKKWILIAPDHITQGNDIFWMIMREVLISDSQIELQIILPGWSSLKRLKAINYTRTSRIYRAIADADLAIYTPYNSNIVNIQDSLHFVTTAMAIGTPCVVSKNMLTCEIVKHKETGIIAPINRPFLSTTNIINFMSNNEQKKKCMLNAQKMIRDKYDIRITVAQYESILFGILKEKRNTSNIRSSFV